MGSDLKILIIGMNPSGRDLKHKKGPTLTKLESWMDSIGVHHFSFMNTFDKPGKAKKANVDINRLCKITKEYSKILALGGFVSETLNTLNVSHFKLPHPSPLNRLLNDKHYEKQILSKCKDYLND